MRSAAGFILLVLSCCTCREHHAPAPLQSQVRFRKVDVHVHAPPETGPRLLALMDAWGIDVAVNLSGGWPGAGLEASLAAARRSQGRVVVFANPPFSALATGQVSIEELVDQLAVARALGARGVKIFKSLGLGVRGRDEKLLAVDDPRLDPLFDAAGALGLPVSIHTGDPKAFWLPPTPENERFDELSVHPDWSNFERPVPSWEDLFSAYRRRVARHPKTTFIGVHFGNAPEDPAAVAAMLDDFPNLFIDTAARIPEIGRLPPDELRAFFLRFQDRVLFGSDLGIGSAAHQMMLGSSGASAPEPEDVRRFFEASWRYFETTDVDFAHPTPVQGRWTISGLGLPPEVLKKVYSANAERVLGVTEPHASGDSRVSDRGQPEAGVAFDANGETRAQNDSQ